MSTIKEQLNNPYVGEFVELWDIDLTAAGGTMYRLTAHSHEPIQWRGNSYDPFPIEATNVSRNVDSAPSRIRLRVSNVNSMLQAAIIQQGDMLGADVTRWRTFKDFLDGEANADPNQHFPIERYNIIKKEAFGPDGIEFILATKLDRPNLILPRRQILRDPTGRAGLHAPGVARSGIR